jgi:predicted MFS family arabinose efflux permease
MTVVGGSSLNILPLLAAAAEDTLGFSDRQSGLMSVAITVGAGAGAILAGMWVRSVPWPRAALLALGGMLAANLLAMVFHRYWAFMLVQGAAGFFGTSVLCLALTILSDRHDSARIFGVAGAIQVAYQIAALLAGPTLLRLAGLNGILAMLAAISGLTLFLAPLLPTHGRLVAAARVPTALFKPATLIGLLAFFTFFVNIGAYWTYIELMGEAQGMTSRVVANGISVGISAGIVGGALAWALGERFGRLWPIGMAALLTVVAALLLNGSFSVAAFVASGLLYFFAWNYSYPYQLAIVNEVDITGRAVAVTQGFGALGMAGGAGFAAFFVSPGDYRAVIWLATVAVCLSTALYGLSSTVHRYAATSVQAKV